MNLIKTRHLFLTDVSYRLSGLIESYLLFYLGIMKKNENAESLLVSEKTPWGTLEVWQAGSVRSLYFQDKKAIQSQLDLQQKEKLLLPHTQAMMSFLLFQPNPHTALLLGLGGGGILHFLCYWFPEIKITAVDISQNVVDIGEKYFSVSTTPQVNIETIDASMYLKNSKDDNIDVILVDLHNGDCLPGFLSDSEFMAQCLQTLSLNGMLVINLLIKKEQDFTEILIALRQSFKGVSLCMTFKDQKNVLLFAFKSPSVLKLTDIDIRAAQCQKKYDIEFETFVDGIIKIDEKCL